MLSGSPLFQTLPAGPLDIIGDVHGEWTALQQLLHHLGYREDGSHPQRRKAVFVGDLCDRGPDSPAVLSWVLDAVHAGRAFAVAGNHEINLLADDVKEGSGWFFDGRPEDEALFSPWHRLPADRRAETAQALAEWPLVLQRPGLTVVHAAYLPDSLRQIAQAGSAPLLAQYRQAEDTFADTFAQHPLYEAYLDEQQRFGSDLYNEHAAMTMLPGTTAYDLLRSNANPVRALTCGVEAPAPAPFYTNGRWRFTVRMPWWQHYAGADDVVIGHYWRHWYGNPQPEHRRSLFDMPPDAWMGRRQKVFCVDYSIGARWKERLAGVPEKDSRCHLAALRLPEEVIMLETGVAVPSKRRPAA